ncbi:MAG: PepSY-associated TM helix domain-containing protein [Bacteroidota bacterium]
MDKQKRNYNVFFNTHTVSGIVISIGLFVCFLAGGFALFLDEINYWQEGAKREVYTTDIDYDRVLSLVEEENYEMEGRSFFIGLRENIPNYIQVSSQALTMDSTKSKESVSSKDSLAHASIFLKINPDTYQVEAREFDRETKKLGTFLYHLHYFEQIPAVGIYLAGLVALFFSFALFTGIIVHWKKIVSNFFTFRLKSSIKNLWTDGHTALGVIGIPFQLMYAVTGSFFGLIIILYLPFLVIVFDNDVNKLTEAFNPVYESDSNEVFVDTGVTANSLVSKTTADLDPQGIERVSTQITDYGEPNAQLKVTVQLNDLKYFFGTTHTTYRMADGKLLNYKPVEENSYTEVATQTMAKLHFAQFGGYLIKAIYFLLAIVTCFVIISGVMVWLTAREKKTYNHKAKFNRNVGAIYLGTCLGLYPAIALFFCLVKVFPMEIDHRFGIMSNIFFLFWLAFTIYAYFLKSPFKINKHALILASVLGFLVPVLNGLQSGLWLWKSWGMGYIDSFFIDASWLAMSIISFWAAMVSKPVIKKQSMMKDKATDQRFKEEPIKIRVNEPVLAANSLRE